VVEGSGERGVQGEIQYAGVDSVREGYVEEEVEGYDDGVGVEGFLIVNLEGHEAT
jgi:hypothetical protein